MNYEVDPGKIRRRVYMSYFQDGLWDILLGLFLLSWGFTVLFDLSWLPGVAFICLFWLVLGIKRKITYPRTGYSRPVEQRKQMMRLIVAGVVILLFGVLLFFMAFTGGAPEFLYKYFELIFGVILAVVIALIGFWWSVFRWYGYAGLILVMAVINQWTVLSFSMSFILPGAAVLIYGVYILTRFIRNNPVIKEETTSEK